MALKKEQLIALLLALHKMDYVQSTIATRWRLIFKIATELQIPIHEDVLDLYDFVLENATDKPDRKLPVSLKLLKQQLKALDKFLKPGYENTLARAVLSLAWAAQLRVSEYTSKKIADVYAGLDDHNLGANEIMLQDDGVTLIFLSGKSARRRQERFLEYKSVPIPKFRQILEDYDDIRIKSSPVFFCHPDGSNITPNDVADWIELSTLYTDWFGLKITSHCYR